MTSKNAFEIEKENVLVKQCSSWWPNAQVCFTNKIGNVGQAMSFRLAGALERVTVGGGGPTLFRFLF